MSRILLFVLFATLLTACLRPPEDPAFLIPEQKMAEILVALHTEEAAVSEMRQSRRENYLLFRQRQKAIFEQHGVDSAQFFSSFEFYIGQAQRLERIYAAASDTIGVKREALKVMD